MVGDIVLSSPELNLKRVECIMSKAMTRGQVSANKLNLEFGLLGQVEKSTRLSVAAGAR
jgi:hypothetical protein